MRFSSEQNYEITKILAVKDLRSSNAINFCTNPDNQQLLLNPVVQHLIKHAFLCNTHLIIN